jgi:multicomponent K+:H+ antiporter subunit C
VESILALAIGVLTGSGVWLLLRPRTFQVISHRHPEPAQGR